MDAVSAAAHVWGHEVGKVCAEEEVAQRHHVGQCTTKAQPLWRERQEVRLGLAKVKPFRELLCPEKGAGSTLG